MRLVLVAAGLIAVPAFAQSPIYPSGSAGTGALARTYIFAGSTGLNHASQLVVPVFAGIPIGRQFFVDVTANYAVTEVEGTSGVAERLDGVTDTQVRGSLTLGRDLAVLSASVNVPTGKATIEADQLTVLGTTAQTFLPFAVTNYGTGFGATTGLAVARSFGSWNLGVAGAVRYVNGYQPVSDPAVGGEYKPGVEGRVRLGADRLLGERGRLTVGVTWTSFGTDEFSGQIQAGAFRYHPGSRLIAEASLAHQVGRSSIQGYGWAYFRDDGRTTSDSGSSLSGAENLYNLGFMLLSPLGTTVVLDPGVDLRVWYPGGHYAGYLLVLRVGARFRVADSWSLAPAVGWGDGWTTTSQGTGTVTGWSANLMVRIGR